MAKRITVVVSQGQSANPAKRGLEEDIVAALIMEPGIDVTVVPHLYDLKADGTGVLALEGITGDLIVLSWLYERGARWTLDRHGIRGQAGRTLLVQEDEKSDDEDDDGVPEGESESAEEKARVADQRPIPRRRIYCIELNARPTAQAFVDEIRRIAEECRMQLVSLGDWISGQPAPDPLRRFIQPTNDTALPLTPRPAVPASRDASSASAEIEVSVQSREPVRIHEDPDRRWYPVIDYSRCTNCMECIDFCLFGVYGVDKVETILVEQPDNCRKGCPACSRVCPENAIIFPQHKTPAIAGAPVDLVGLKIDLSKLFGAPDEDKTPAEIAARERDEQLMLAGREPVGMGGSMPRRQQGKPVAGKDELDALLDELDGANL